MILKERYLPLTGKYEYTFVNTVGKCFSAGKIQEYAKNNLIKVYNRVFTEQEYLVGTYIGLREPNGISVTKDIILLVLDDKLKNNEINWIENALVYVKNNIELFVD